MSGVGVFSRPEHVLARTRSVQHWPNYAEKLARSGVVFLHMELPVQITFRNMNSSEAVADRVREEAVKLDTFFDRITSCRVVVETAHRHHKWGDLYSVHIDLGVPGAELVVRHEPSVHSSVQHSGEEKWHRHLEPDAAHKDVYVAVRDSFKAMRRQLQDYIKRLRGEVKTHQTHAVAGEL